MKILWVNNVSSILGGTMQCTLCMIQALPDCEHSVFSFSRWPKDPDHPVGLRAGLLHGSSLAGLHGKYDLVVYQNISETRLPNKSLGFSVYIHHSSRADSLRVGKRCDMQLCVSYYLANLLGLPGSTVLHQPVFGPSGSCRKPAEFTVGRICTPTPKKWREADVLPAIESLLKTEPDVRVHLVGAPDSIGNLLCEEPRVKLSKPSLQAQGYMQKWHCLLNLSSVPETFGRTCREAQRRGCVPVVMAGSGYDEQVYGGAGLAVNSAGEAVSVVRRLMHGQEEYSATSQRCVEVGDQEGSLTVWRQRFLKRLEESVNHG